MAKMIKCPTCGTQIEVPAAPTGQIVKCPGCGKGLKLVAKKPAGQQPAQPANTGAGSGGSMAGQSMSAMTYVGEPPAMDDMPNLDSNCVVCGRPTDPENLVEDNGRMVCPDCVKGARSRVDRPTGGAEMIGFKQPMPAPVRRAKLINITPSFLIGTLAALVFIGCQIYLSFFEKPVGNFAQNMNIKKGSAAATAPAPDEFATPPSQPAEPAPAATNPSAAQPTTPAPATPNPTDQAAATTPPPTPAAPATQDASSSSIFNENPQAQAPTPAPIPAAPIPAPGAHPPAIASLANPNDPLAQGIDKLQMKDYVGATAALEKARSKFVLGKIGDKLTPEQQATLVGLAAANIGRNQPQAAKPQLDLVMSKGEKSRSAVLNDAIAVAMKRSSPKELNDVAAALRNYLSSNRDDEYAANIFGTLLDHVQQIPNPPKDWLEEQWRFLDGYDDQIAANGHPDQLKWGTEWLQADLVRQYRANRGKTGAAASSGASPQLKKDVEAAQAKVYTLQQALTQAKQAGGDVIGAQNQLNAALADLGRLQMQMNQAGAPPRPPVWLSKFDPVVPEGVTTTQ